METTIVYWGCIGIMENKMETTIVYWGYIGMMENEMETTIVYWGYIGKGVWSVLAFCAYTFTIMFWYFYA